MTRSVVRLSVISLCIACGAASAHGAVVVVPNAQANALGNGQSTRPLRTYGTGGSRYQQVYTAATFGGLGAEEEILQVAFRAKQPALGNFIVGSVSVSNIIITLSTTQRDDVGTLSPTFADNIGSDVTTVYSGPLTLTASAPGSTAIDYTIALSSLFTYRKAMGNLLLDVTIPDNATVSGPGTIGFSQFDTFTDAFPSGDGIGSASGASGSATIGSNSTTGLVTKFTTRAVPAPGVATLAMVSVGFGLTRRRR